MRRFIAVLAVGLCIAVWAGAFSSVAIGLDVRSPSGFVHPGLLSSQQQLAAFKKAVNGDRADSAFRIAYQAIKDDPRASYRYGARPMATVEIASYSLPPEEKRFKDDAMAAYLNALQWVATSDPRHRDKAIEIMDGWAATFERLVAAPGTPAAARQLESAWTLPMWANAAEIIRHYDSGAARWSAEAIAVFDRFIDKLLVQARRAQLRPNNWGVSSALAMMAAGVFQDDRIRYTEGLTRLKRLLPEIIDASGEVRELRSRDCHHPQYSLIGFVQAAMIAANQRDDAIWRLSDGRDNPILARGLEYMATALTDGTEARDCRRRGSIGRLLAGYGAIAVAELRRLGIPIPRFEAVTRANGPDRESFQFVGWSAAIHGQAAR
jgi:hypothetical protein